VFLSAVTVIALGYLLRKTGLVTRDHGNALARIVINVTLPAVILETLPQVELRSALLVFPFLALVHTAVAFSLATLLFRRRPAAERGLMTMCSMGFNNGLFAFPIVLGIWGAEAIRILAIFDVGNGLVVLGLNYVVAGWFGGLAAAGAHHGTPLNIATALRRVAKTVVTSVPMVAFALALVMNLLDLSLPAVVARPVGTVAGANGALALLVLGIFQSMSIRRSDVPIIAQVLGLRYLLGAAVAAVSILVVGNTELYRQILAIVFILPIGMTTIPFSVEFGLDTRLVTTLVNVSIVVSFALMWAVVAVAG
jgi:predicted permease